MPARISRSSIPLATPKTGRKKTRKRHQEAYSIASHSASERNGVPRHRLGETVDDGPVRKRRRSEDDDDDEGEGGEDEDAHPRKRSAVRGPNAEDDVERGSDSEGNEWVLGGLAEDDEDSDLDSDDAFGESDEERFANFTFRGSSSGAQKPGKRTKRAVVASQGNHIDLDELDVVDDEEEDDDLGEDAVDLATMLDNDDDDPATETSQLSASNESDEEDEISSSEEDEQDEDDDAGDEERVARLRDRLERMEEKPIPSGAPLVGDSTITVEDLLADLDPASQRQFAAALKTKKKSAKPTTLAVPLPKRQRDRIDREVASAKAKEQLDRWRDTVIHNRRAEFLSFPLQAPDRMDPVGKDKFLRATPHTELEQSIQRIMEESGMASNIGQDASADGENVLMKSEELATNQMPIEEVMRRRAELRRTRELLFREEIKARRIAKIKSKAYRRVHRKERERMAEKERELMDQDGRNRALDENEKERFDRRRAEERMGTKHRESKWAKSLKATNRTAWDGDARENVLEKARRNDELKRRIAGEDITGDNESDVSSQSERDLNDESDEDENVVRQLRKIGQTNAGRGGRTGIAGMKFMQAAEERRRAQNDEDVKRLREELAEEDEDTHEDEEEGREEQGLGRAIFGPNASDDKKVPSKIMPLELEEEYGSGDEEDGIVKDEVETKTEQHSAAPPPRKPTHTRDRIPKKTNGTRGSLARDKLSVSTVEPESGLSWLTDAGAKQSKKDRRRTREVDNEAPLMLQDGESTTNLNREYERTNDLALALDNRRPAVENPTTDSASDGDADIAPTEDPILSQKAAYQQRAFAGDDVHVAFSAEKSALTKSEETQEISTHLPGWGSWAGAGLSKRTRQANQKAAHNPLYRSKLPGGVKASDRRDARPDMDRVMVSEKQDRKGKRFLATQLPRGFEAQAQYERSLRVPVGPEWTTKRVFQRATRPRVVVKQGVVEAMEIPLV